MSRDGKVKLYYVHVLVAQAFIANPDNLPEVNHKDEDKVNNEASNLEWCTHEYNSNHGTRANRISKANTNNKKVSKPVLCIETGVIYPSVHEASRQMNLDFSEIARVCRGYRNRKTAGGYHSVTTINNVRPDSNGNVNVAGLPLGFEYFQTNPNIRAGSLPLTGGLYSRELYADFWS